MDINPDGGSRRVKIAILDTGIDLNHPDMQACAENIMARYNWLQEDTRTTVHDVDGHGTFVAGILLDYAPDAEIYVAKIAERKLAHPYVIAKVVSPESSLLVMFSTKSCMRTIGHRPCRG